jgi:hypothetical protein
MKYIYILSFIGSYFSSEAQTGGRTATLTYDFSKGSFVAKDLTAKGTVKPLAFNSFATIRIINVNTFRYKVEIRGQSIDYITQVPSELQAIFRLPDQSGSRKNTEEALNDIKTFNAEVQNQVSVNKQNLFSVRTELFKVRNNLVQAENDAQVFKVQKNKVNNGSSDLDRKFEIANDKVETLSEQRQMIEEQVTALSEFEKVWLKLAAAAQHFNKITGHVAEIKFRRVELINLVKQNWASYGDMQEHTPAPLSSVDMQGSFKDFGESYATVLSLSNEAKAVANTDQKTQVEGLMSQLKSAYDRISEDGFLNLIQDIVVLQQAMEEENSFTVVSPPIQVDGDYSAFTIKATPARASDLMNYTADKTFPVELPTKGGSKVDFSVGPTISFGKNALDRKYYLEPILNEDTVILLERKNNNDIAPGLAAMMHFYARSGMTTSWGGLFGIGAGFHSADNVDVNIYAGLSLIVGKRQKIMLNTGVSYLRVDRLKSSEFTLGNKYASSQISLDKTIEKVYKPSLFLSISYNITNRVVIN